MLVYNSLISAAFLAACASFLPGMPFAAMIAILLAGGFFRSLQFTAVNTIAYAEIEPPLMSRATTLVSVAQQLALSTGVAVGALVVEITLRLRHGAPSMTPRIFRRLFSSVGALTAACEPCLSAVAARCWRRARRTHFTPLPRSPKSTPEASQWRFLAGAGVFAATAKAAGEQIKLGGIGCGLPAA